MVYVPMCLRASVVHVPRACYFFIFMCQRVIRDAIVLSWHANVTNSLPIFQIDQPTCLLLRKAKENLYTLLLHKKIYILLGIIVTYILCRCIINKNCIILYFYTLCLIKEKCVEFFLFSLLLCSQLSKYKQTWLQYVTSNKGFLDLSTGKTTKQKKEYVGML